MNVTDVLARMGDRQVNFTAQMYLDDEPPIAGGRDIWGFPKKHAQSTPAVARDTLTGSLHYAAVQVALGTISYKNQHLLCDVALRGVPSGLHFIADLTLPYGRVMHDYLAH